MESHHGLIASSEVDSNPFQPKRTLMRTPARPAATQAKRELLGDSMSNDDEDRMEVENIPLPVNRGSSSKHLPLDSPQVVKSLPKTDMNVDMVHQ